MRFEKLPKSLSRLDCDFLNNSHHPESNSVNYADGNPKLQIVKAKNLDCNFSISGVVFEISF